MARVTTMVLADYDRTVQEALVRGWVVGNVQVVSATSAAFETMHHGFTDPFVELRGGLDLGAEFDEWQTHYQI